MFIHEYDNWTDFRWDYGSIAVLLDDVAREQGRLYGRLNYLGFDDRLRAMSENMVQDVVHSSEIEGIRLNSDEVRSSVARHLGIEAVKYIAPSHYIDSLVAVMLDAIEHCNDKLTHDKLCAWQSAFFPTGHSEGIQIEVGKYRTHDEHIVSGSFGRERVHYIAPSPGRVPGEMQRFIDWYNSDKNTSPILCSAIAHFWFVSIHPFEDGNGRLARILGDILLARGDKSRFRFYNISSEINRDKKHYYDILESTQRGDGDITGWLLWYLQTLFAALHRADVMVNTILNKSVFWANAAGIPLTRRQTETLNIFLDGYEAKLTSKKWAELNKCSKDTAIRDIQDLLQKGVLQENVPGAKRPSYSINYAAGAANNVFATRFHNVRIEGDFLIAEYEGRQVRERIIKLDAERYAKGELPLETLLQKYCSYYSL